MFPFEVLYPVEVYFRHHPRGMFHGRKRISIFRGPQYICIRQGGLAGIASEHYLVPTGCRGGRLTSCPWTAESGSNSVASAGASALRRFSSSDSSLFCRSMVAFTPTLSGAVSGPTAPQPTNIPNITLVTTDVAAFIHIFTRVSDLVL